MDCKSANSISKRGEKMKFEVERVVHVGSMLSYLRAFLANGSARRILCLRKNLGISPSNEDCFIVDSTDCVAKSPHVVRAKVTLSTSPSHVACDLCAGSRDRHRVHLIFSVP
jgi:hypothetical protein